MPEWEKFSENENLNVALYDCDNYWDICAQYNIDALPTFIWFPAKNDFENKWFTYDGLRLIGNWIEFSLKHGYKR